MPFFAWQCLSFTLAHREVDIVIKNQKEQNNIVKFLLYKLNTIDGRKDSAKGVIQVLEKQALEKYKIVHNIKSKDFKISDLPHSVRSKMRLNHKVNVMRTCYMKYTIMKFRMKISWLAFKNKMTILELFCTAILKSYTQMVAEGSIKINKSQLKLDNKLFQYLTNGLKIKDIFNCIIKINIPKIKDGAMKEQMVKQLTSLTQKDIIK